MVFFARAVKQDKSDGNSASLVKLFIASTEGPKNQYLANHRICMCEKHRLRVSFYFAQADSRFMIIGSNEKQMRNQYRQNTYQPFYYSELFSFANLVGGYLLWGMSGYIR